MPLYVLAMAAFRSSTGQQRAARLEPRFSSTNASVPSARRNSCLSTLACFHCSIMCSRDTRQPCLPTGPRAVERRTPSLAAQTVYSSMEAATRLTVSSAVWRHYLTRYRKCNATDCSLRC
eukprot:05206_5